MKGYTGKLLRVNLSNGQVSKEEIPESTQRDFLGGRGFAMEDVVTAHRAYEKAIREGKGQRIEMSSS